VDDLVAGIEALIAQDEWPGLLYAGSGVATPLLEAAELAVAAAGREVTIQTPGGTLPPGEDDSYTLDPHAPRLGSPARPLSEAVPAYVDWLRSHPAAQGRAGA
jgi:nucleoside-diphosphate-sugar epimerase